MRKDLVCQEDYGHRIWGAVPIIVRGMYRVLCLLINRLTFLLSYLSRRLFLAAFRQTYPSRLKSASLILRIFKALCLDVFVPGVFSVPIEVIVIDGELTTDVIHDVWGSRPACAVDTDRRVMDFRRRPGSRIKSGIGSDEPDAQVIED